MWKSYKYGNVLKHCFETKPQSNTVRNYYGFGGYFLHIVVWLWNMIYRDLYRAYLSYMHNHYITTQCLLNTKHNWVQRLKNIEEEIFLHHRQEFSLRKLRRSQILRNTSKKFHFIQALCKRLVASRIEVDIGDWCLLIVWFFQQIFGDVFQLTMLES